MPRKLSKEKALEKALQLLQENGYAIKSPDLAEESAKQAENDKALGVIKPARATSVKPSKKQRYVCELRIAHTINNTRYGPGLTECPDNDTLHMLLSQDQAAIKQQMRDFEPQPRCYVIGERTDNDGRKSAVGIRVNSDVFNAPDLPDSMVYKHIDANSIGIIQSEISNFGR